MNKFSNSEVFISLKANIEKFIESSSLSLKSIDVSVVPSQGIILFTKLDTDFEILSAFDFREKKTKKVINNIILITINNYRYY